MTYIPQNCEEETKMLPYESTGDEIKMKLDDIIPTNPNQPYDIKEVIEELVDEQDFFEVHKNFAENIVVGFGRLGGRLRGVR